LHEGDAVVIMVDKHIVEVTECGNVMMELKVLAADVDIQDQLQVITIHPDIRQHVSIENNL
jgi:hypothetical protein